MSEHQPEELNEAPTAGNLDLTRRRFLGACWRRNCVGGGRLWSRSGNADANRQSYGHRNTRRSLQFDSYAHNWFSPGVSAIDRKRGRRPGCDGADGYGYADPAHRRPPEPEPTDTPEPTATPVPPATPFPPGPPSKLGLVVARNHPQIFDVLATKAITAVCTLELDAGFAAQIKQTSPGTRLIGRLDVPTPDMANFDPIAAANEFVQKVLPFCR